MNQKFSIDVDDLSDGGVTRLLAEHRIDMLSHSPSESVHALDATTIEQSGLTFYSVKIKGVVQACAALKRLSEAHAEIKSMKVSPTFVGKGIGRALVAHLLTQARTQQYTRISLETGTASVFLAARNLYQSAGFEKCPPFDNYQVDEHSICMTLNLSRH